MNKLDRFKKAIVNIQNSEESISKDYTDDFIKMLKKYPSTNKDWEFTMMVMGTQGSGKTCFVTMIANIIMQQDERWKLAIYDAENLVKLLQYASPFKKERIYSVKSISYVKPYSIYVVDEGIIGKNAKEALTQDSIRFEKYIAIHRHRHIIVIICTQTDGILLKFRQQVKFKVFKFANPNTFMSDKLVREYADYLSVLPITDHVFFAYHKYFKKGGKHITKGRIVMDVNDYCEWWNEDISLNNDVTNTDVEEAIELGIKMKTLMSAVQLGFKHFGIDDILSGGFHTNFVGFLISYDPVMYVELKRHINHIKALMTYISNYYHTPEAQKLVSKFKLDIPELDIKQNVEQQVTKDIAVSTVQNVKKKEVHTFAGYVHNKFIESNAEKAFILYDYLRGMSFHDTKNHLDFGYYKVRDTVNEYIQNEVGFDFEDYFNKHFLEIDYEAPHRSHKPDCIYKGYPISLKFKSNVRRGIEYIQDKDFHPELTYAIENKLDFYFIVLYNPKWGMSYSITKVMREAYGKYYINITKDTTKISEKSELDDIIDRSIKLVK
jgi:energy-coupling factor transporter ATP-binding protein EcfA2